MCSSKRKMMAYLATLLGAVVSTASASSRSAASSGTGRPADPRLTNSLRREASSLTSGKQMLNDGLSILGGALDDGGDVRRRRKTGEEYGEENSHADDDPLINGDDLALLDSIFGSSSSTPSSSTTSASAPSTSALAENGRRSGAVAYDEYDPIGDVGMDLVDDDEIDGLFERAGRLLEAEGEEEYGDYDEVGQYFDDDLQDEGQRAAHRPTMEDVIPEEEEQIDNLWKDPHDLYEYDPYDEYLPVGGYGGANDDVFDADDQWGGEYSHQEQGEDRRYDELLQPFEEEGYDTDVSPVEKHDYANDDNGVYDYEYDYTDPTLAMDDDEAFLESVDEPELHEDAGSQQMSGHEQEYQDVISDGAKYQQSSDRLPPAEPGNLLEDQDDLEFDPAFADAAIAAARMEEEEEREFEAEANADNTDNAADFDYIYEDRSLMFEFVDDEDAFVTKGTPKHPHHPVPPVHAADSTIDSIIRAHRIAVAKDLGIEAPPGSASSSSSSTTSSAVAGTQQRQAQPQGTHSQSHPSSNHPRAYNRSPGYGLSGNGGGGPFDDPERNARLEARRQKNERNFRRETASDVHKTFSTAISSVIRGDASPHVPANLYGQTLEEERAGCKLAGLSPEFDRNGIRNGKFCSDEELQSYVEWSSLLQSLYGDQCGAVDIQTAKAKLYGGAQYHRAIRCFSALLLTLPLPEITQEELSLLLTASGSAGSGSHGAAGHDGPDLLRTAAILCRTKMEGLVRFALDELTGRVEYILRDRCWECIKYSALVRPASEAGTGAATNYGSGNGSRRRNRDDVGDEAAYKYADLEEIFKEVAAEAYTKFVKQSVSEAAQLGWTDALALLRYVSWDLTMPKPKPKRKTAPSASSRYGQSSSDIKPIRGGAGNEAGLYSSDESISPNYAESPSQTNRQTEPYRSATPVRPVKQSKRIEARERRAKVAAEKAAKLRKEEEANQGFFSKVRLFRRTRRDDGAPLDADVSAYYDLNELYGLDDEFDGDGEMNDEDMGDLVGGVLSRGAVDDEGAVHSSGSLAVESPLESQLSSKTNEDGDAGYNKLSRNQEMEEDEMLSILLRAAAVAASSNKGGMGESQTRAAMQALVQFVTDRWRRDLIGLIVGKFNSFCLLGFHSEFGAYLRKEFEAKLVELEEEAAKRRRR